jgi:hypothetical protein
MNILILNVNISWIFKLYDEYITSFEYFIKKYYKNINITILYYDIKIFDLNTFEYSKYDSILYCGDIDILHKLFVKYKKIYYINIEQLSHSSYYNIVRTINSDINIIDYSEENIPFLKDNYTYFLFPPFYNITNNFNKKTIDVLSICNNLYRETIFNSIVINQKFSKIIINNSFGKDRDNYFDKTKIYINIHCSDNHKTMELIRLVNLIFRGVIIISQESIYNELLFLKDYIIICNDINMFSTYINEILNNYDFYYNKIYNNFNKQIYINYIKEHLDKFIAQLSH